MLYLMMVLRWKMYCIQRNTCAVRAEVAQSAYCLATDRPIQVRSPAEAKGFFL
jgi:hypothetical protein